MGNYSSKDFGKTKSHCETQVPEILHHPNVEERGKDFEFSSERKHPVFVVDVPSRTISMTIGHLGEGQSTRRHRHTYETILYILEGEGETTVEDRVVKWKAGDAVYVPVWAWHSHMNLGRGNCRYVACENAPLMQNLGAAIREEE